MPTSSSRRDSFFSKETFHAALIEPSSWPMLSVLCSSHLKAANRD